MAHFNSFQIHIGLVLVQTILLEMRENEIQNKKVLSMFL